MDHISKLKDRYLLLIASSGSEVELEQVRLDALGKKGEITQKMRELGTMPSDKRQIMGPLLNNLKECVNQALRLRKDELAEINLESRLQSEWIDISRSTREGCEGSIHPVSQVTEEVITIFGDFLWIFLPK